MKRSLLVLAVAVASGVLPAIVLAQTATTPAHVTIALRPQNDSGESGAATLQQQGDDLLVYVRVTNPTAPVQPAHIHEGTCAKLNPVPKYPLSPIKDGRSTTRIKNLQLASLLASAFAINVHKSPNEVATYVACGNIIAK